MIRTISDDPAVAAARGSSWERRLAGGLLLFGLCFTLFALRNLEPIVSPNLYAEDGTWAGLILQHGALHTAFGARDAFPVLGLILLDWAALQLNYLVFNSSFFQLPLSIFLVANGFSALIALAPVAAFRGVLPLWVRLCLMLCVVLMPTGSSGNEIFGRNLNLGFLFPLLTVCAIHVSRQTSSNAVFALQLCLVAVTSLTFPVCLAMGLVWLLAELCLLPYRRKAGVPSSRMTLPRIGAGLAVIVACTLLMPPDVFTAKGGADLPFSGAGLIDFTFGRLIVYPFAAASYNLLTDISTLVVVALLLGMCLVALLKGRGPERSLIWVMTLGFGVYWAATAVMRSGFTSIFGTYQNTYPDRYAYGLNVLAAWLAIIAAHRLWCHGSRAWPLGALAVSALLLNAVGMLPRTFQLSQPLQPMQQFGDIRMMTCAMIAGTLPAAVTFDGDLVHVPIYPKTEENQWKMTMPREVWDRTVKGQCQ